MLIMEIVFLSSRVCSRGTAGKNEGEGKPPNSQCPSVTHRLALHESTQTFISLVCKSWAGLHQLLCVIPIPRRPRELWHRDWSCSPLQALSATQLLTEKATAASHPSKSRKPSVHEWGETGCGFSCVIPFQCRNLENTIRCSPGNGA